MTLTILAGQNEVIICDFVKDHGNATLKRSHLLRKSADSLLQGLSNRAAERFSRGPRAEAFTRQLCRDIVVFAGIVFLLISRGHNCWES